MLMTSPITSGNEPAAVGRRVVRCSALVGEGERPHNEARAGAAGDACEAEAEGPEAAPPGALGHLNAQRTQEAARHS